MQHGRKHRKTALLRRRTLHQEHPDRFPCQPAYSRGVSHHSARVKYTLRVLNRYLLPAGNAHLCLLRHQENDRESKDAQNTPLAAYRAFQQSTCPRRRASLPSGVYSGCCARSNNRRREPVSARISSARCGCIPPTSVLWAGWGRPQRQQQVQAGRRCSGCSLAI